MRSLPVPAPTLGRLGLCLALALGLAACATPPSVPTQRDGLLVPNANLHVDGVPPLPAAMAAEVTRYADFSGHRFVDWHPNRREMLVATRLPERSTTQLYRLAAPMAALEPLTDGPEPVASGHFEPLEGRYIVFAQASGGNEAYRLHRMDLPSRRVTPLTDADQRSAFGAWLHGRSAALVTSVPLDRTAQGGRREGVATVLWLLDPERPAERRRLAELPGAGWWVAAVSRDDRRAALTRYVSDSESEIWLLDLASGQRRRVLPAAGSDPRATHFAVEFGHDGASVLLHSDRVGDFRELWRLSLADGALTRVTGHIPWDVSESTLSSDGAWLALQANVEGRDELRLFDGARLSERAAPALPAGNIGSTKFHPRLPLLAFTLDNAQGPGQIHSLDPASGEVLAWTRPHVPPGADPGRFAEPELVRWRSFDGRMISGWLHRPPVRFAGPRPVLINIHGGPSAQARAGFAGRQNYLVHELGIAVIQPNVRGSSGYGKQFLALDNGRLREDAVRDIGALLDWIATQPGLDARRVAVTGGSYGGFMSLATAVHHADRIAGAISVVGISHFVTFLERTESYRRDLRRVEYGDERDPAMREFLHRISPLTHAERITRPLFVVHGRNDPRVPVGEAEQIVTRVRANGTPVWYLRAENEGHGFVRKDNADFYFYATVRFLQQVLLSRNEGPLPSSLTPSGGGPGTGPALRALSDTAPAR